MLEGLRNGPQVTCRGRGDGETEAATKGRKDGTGRGANDETRRKERSN